jgi:rod shape-determining protein MreD
MRIAVRVGLIIVTAMVIEQGVAPQLRIAGVSADVLLLCAVCAGVVGGPDAGALVGFFAGLALDLVVASPMGLGALAYCLAGYGTGMLRGQPVRALRWQRPLLVAVGSALGILLYVAASSVVGHSGLWSSRLLTVIAVVAGVNALLSGVGVRVMRWALGDAALTRSAVR